MPRIPAATRCRRTAEISLELRDPQTYQPIWNDTAKLNDYGSAHWDYTIPADAHLGTYYLSMQMGEQLCRGLELLGAGLQEARIRGEGHGADAARPARPAHQGDHRRALLLRRAGGQCQGEVGGAHLAVLSAGPLGVGRRQLGEGDEGEGDEGQYDQYGAGEQEQENSGTLDADGKLQITVPTTVSKQHQDLTYRIEARVTDAGNREISGRGYAIATYGSFYLTAQPDAYVYSKGSTAKINVAAQDYDKKPVATAFKAEISRWNWQKRSGEVVSTTQGQTDADGKGQVDFVDP